LVIEIELKPFTLDPPRLTKGSGGGLAVTPLSRGTSGGAKRGLRGGRRAIHSGQARHPAAHLTVSGTHAAAA